MCWNMYWNAQTAYGNSTHVRESLEDGYENIEKLYSQHSITGTLYNPPHPHPHPPKKLIIIYCWKAFETS